MSATKYSQSEAPHAAEIKAWPELACAILRGLRIHTTLLKDEGREQFQRYLDETAKALRQSPSATSLQVYATTIEDKIREYFEATQRDLDNSFGELRQLASVLMSSLTQGEQTDQNTTASLAEIEKTVQMARSPGELAVAKIHLVQALDRLRSQSDERRQSNSHLLTTLQQRAHALELAPAIEASLGAGPTGLLSESIAPSAIGPTDTITGLYGRQAAEALLLSLDEKAKANSYVVAFYVQRMELINSRFGDRMGTDVLCYCAQHFARLVQPCDQLFRWRGPGFVAVLSRGRSLSDVRQEVNAAYRTRMTFEGSDNSVLIPLAIVTQVWPDRKIHAAEMIQNIETFFSLPATRAMAEPTDSSGRVGAPDEDFIEANN